MAAMTTFLLAIFGGLSNLIGESVVLFGKNRDSEIVHGCTIIRAMASTILATKGQFQNPYFCQIAQISHANNVMLTPHRQDMHG